MLVATSFLSSKNIPKDLKKLDVTSTDYIHVDVMDGKFVKNKTMPFSEMKNIYKYTNKRLDIHLMVENPKKYIEQYATLNAEYITIHLEIAGDVLEYLNLIKSFGLKCGLAIKPNTEIRELVPYVPILDQVLVMSVEPGMGGQEFLLETKERIDELRILLDEYNSNAIISVDGGINNLTKEYCKKCDLLVSGSYIISCDDFEKQIDSLR